MNTIIIYDQCGEADLQFYVLDGDYSHLNKVYINGCDNDELVNEVSSIIENKGLAQFPVKDCLPDTKVIVVGFLP